MKKILIVLTAVLMIGAIFVMADVTSQNVVGFSKVTIPATNGLTLIAIPFDAFSNTLAGVFGTNQLIQGTTKSAANADKVYIWNATLQSFASYAQLTNGEFYSLSGWPASKATNIMSPGMGFWLQSSPTTAVSRTITIMGEVVSVLTQSVEIIAGLQQISYPFSSSIALTNTDFGSDGINKGTTKSAANADKIYVWVVSQYVAYALNGTDSKWYNVSGWPGTPATNTLQMGEGFWFQRLSNTMTWTETNKYAGNL